MVSSHEVAGVDGADHYSALSLYVSARIKDLSVSNVKNFVRVEIKLNQVC